MSFRIIPADPDLVAVVLAIDIDLPALAYVGIDEEEIVGTGGMAWGGGRCWVWYMMPRPKPQYALPVVRTMKVLVRKARQLGETEIFTIRDPQFETSARLVRLAGFEFHAMEDGNEVHRCLTRG